MTDRYPLPEAWPAKAVLLTDGSFGDAAAAAAAGGAWPGLICLPFEGAPGAGHRDVRFVGAVMDRPQGRRCEELDRFCFSTDTRWHGIRLDGPTLISGPTIVPGVGPCYACFRKREASHEPLPGLREAIENAYESDPTLRIEGFLPTMVCMALALLAEAARSGDGRAGIVRYVDLLGQGVEEARVVGVHGCSRCSQRALEPDRFTGRLVGALGMERG